MKTFLQELTLCLFASFKVVISEQIFNDHNRVEHLIRLEAIRNGRLYHSEKRITAREILEFGQEASYINAINQARFELCQLLGEKFIQ